ncbi:deleted in autism-related protein 1 homolog isoform X2 [Limulus polyphemus]|uniref:Deleted in autism-related protein 1 homolog isoform X2 n=1 Tax=Limulus polyphemus TaxID=6850 RepID=A0ABM1T3L7_LIMPO|nr:deleted in autism-related protein 1 homolog isoform X2 [Limulus polyphemus]
MQTLKLWIRMIFRQWYKKLVIAAIFVLGLYCSLQLLDSGKHKLRHSKNTQTTHHSSESHGIVEIDPENQIPDNRNLYKVPKEDIHIDMCPACFGKEICTDIEAGLVEISKNSKTEFRELIMREASLHKTEKVVVSSVTDALWNKFDKFICQNASKSFPCDVSAAISTGYLTSNQALTVDGLRNLYKVLDKSKSEAVLPICATNKLIHELISTFDGNGDRQLNQEEQGHLMTGLLLHPSYVVLKFQDAISSNLPLPNFHGTCGRLAVWEGGMTPLKDHLQESFEERAGLAAQLLQLVDDFQNEDPNWYFLYTEFSYNSFSVTNEGEVLLTDLQDMIIIDKTLFTQVGPHSTQSERLCNEMCYQKFTRDIMTSEYVTNVCSQVKHYGQLMFAIVCKEILSDLEEHKTGGFFNYDGNKVHQRSEYRGLLHSPPEKDKDNIEELLRDCVQETLAGGRKQAVEELQETLDKYLTYNDIDDEKNDKNDDDESEKDEEEGNDIEINLNCSG